MKKKTHLLRLLHGKHVVPFNLEVFGVFKQFLRIVKVYGIADSQHNACPIGLPPFHVELLGEIHARWPEEGLDEALNVFESLASVKR